MGLLADTATGTNPGCSSAGGHAFRWFIDGEQHIDAKPSEASPNYDLLSARKLSHPAAVPGCFSDPPLRA
jgi:hypothetical protein